MKHISGPAAFAKRSQDQRQTSCPSEAINLIIEKSVASPTDSKT